MRKRRGKERIINLGSRSAALLFPGLVIPTERSVTRVFGPESARRDLQELLLGNLSNNTSIPILALILIAPLYPVFLLTSDVSRLDYFLHPVRIKTSLPRPCEISDR